MGFSCIPELLHCEFISWLKWIYRIWQKNMTIPLAAVLPNRQVFLPDPVCNFIQNNLIRTIINDIFKQYVETTVLVHA